MGGLRLGRYLGRFPDPKSDKLGNMAWNIKLAKKTDFFPIVRKYLNLIKTLHLQLSLTPTNNTHKAP